MELILDTYSTRPFPNYQTLYHELNHEAIFKLTELIFLS